MNDDQNFKGYSETDAIHHQMQPDSYGAHTTPVYLTSTFSFDSAEHARALFTNEVPGNIYSRFSNPNTTEFIEKLCIMEGTEDGLSTASGMAAIYVSLAALLNTGDHILASRSVFGSTHQILTKIFSKVGITHTYVEVNAPETWESQIQPSTKIIFIETPSNPGLEIIDLEWIGKLAAKHNLILIVDNCFATPYLQNPAKWGAHIVTHSATKFIDGQGRVIGGAILGKKELIKEMQFFARHTGPAMSPHTAWMLAKSLETLAVRMDRHCSNALAVAQFLENQQGIVRVNYPFLPSHPQYATARKQMRLGGGIVTFELESGLEGGKKFLDALKIITHTATLGDTRTIATHPASTTHSGLSESERKLVGITPGLIRLSIGLEDACDLCDDLEGSLLAARN